MSAAAIYYYPTAPCSTPARAPTAMAAAAAMATHSLLRVRAAAWDTNPSPKPLTIPNPSTTKRKPPISQPPLLSPATTTTTTHTPPPTHTDLFGRRSDGQGKMEDTYLGFERWWLPPPPEVKKPRSIYNAASLAYLGDCIYELYARRHFLFPPLSINEYNERVMKVVRCESQDLLLKKLLEGDYLTQEERDILRWGKNIVTSKTRTRKRAGVAVYNRASSLETLIGYLYLTNFERLEQLMFQLGFSTGASSHHIAEELRSSFRKTSSTSAESQQPAMQ